jgi:integrase
MSSINSTYLYQYKNSSNYFFRIRTSTFFPNADEQLPDQFFVASLRTSILDDARWLAIYIKRNLLKALETQKPAHASSHQLDNDIVDCKSFKSHIKAKFSELLRVGCLLIEHDVADEKAQVSAFNDAHTAQVPVLQSITSDSDIEPARTKPPTQSDITNEALSSQLIASVNMVNELTRQLSETHQKYASAYSISSPADAFSMFSQTSPIQDVELYEKEKNKKSNKLSENSVTPIRYFSLQNQFQRFLNEKKSEIDGKSIKKYQVAFDLLKRLYPGDIDLRTFTKVETQNVKAMLMSRRKNNAQGDNSESLSIKTRNGYLSNYRTFFSWLIKNTDIDIKNPFSDVSFAKAKGKSKSPKRRSFSNEEVKEILSYKPKHANEAIVFRNDAKWLVPISLYSGMRLNEMSALPLDHIRQIDGVWCFDLHGLHVKNEASERTIPIAQYLLDLGLLGYIDELKQSGEQLLFPEIRIGKEKPGSAGWGDPISRWFNRTLLKNVGINSEEEKALGRLVCFHCNRRTMISACVKGLAQHHLIKRIVGHSVEDDITLTVYSDINDIPLIDLKELLDKHLTWHL